MKLKFMNKMIAIMCAATVATSGVVTSVGAVGETKAIQQMKFNIRKLEQKQKELEKENLNDEIKQLNEKISESTKSIKDSKKNIKEIKEEQIKIEKLKQKRAKENRKTNERNDKNKKALKDIDRQIKDANKQVEFMAELKKLNDEIKTFTKCNALKNAGLGYTDVIENKNIMILCDKLKNNFQAHRADAIITQIKKSIQQMKKYRIEHTNQNNQEKLVKEKNNEAIKTKKTSVPVKAKKEDNSVTGVHNKTQAITESFWNKSHLHNNVKPKINRVGVSSAKSTNYTDKIKNNRKKLLDAIKVNLYKAKPKINRVGVSSAKSTKYRDKIENNKKKLLDAIKVNLYKVKPKINCGAVSSVKGTGDRDKKNGKKRLAIVASETSQEKAKIKSRKRVKPRVRKEKENNSLSNNDVLSLSDSFVSRLSNEIEDGKYGSGGNNSLLSYSDSLLNNGSFVISLSNETEDGKYGSGGNNSLLLYSDLRLCTVDNDVKDGAVNNPVTDLLLGLNVTFGGFSGNGEGYIIVEGKKEVEGKKAEDKKENDSLSYSDSLSLSDSFVSRLSNEIEDGSGNNSGNGEGYIIVEDKKEVEGKKAEDKKENNSLSNNDVLSLSDSFVSRLSNEIEDGKYGSGGNNSLLSYSDSLLNNGSFVISLSNETEDGKYGSGGNNSLLLYSDLRLCTVDNDVKDGAVNSLISSSSNNDVLSLSDSFLEHLNNKIEGGSGGNRSEFSFGDACSVEQLDNDVKDGAVNNSGNGGEDSSVEDEEVEDTVRYIGEEDGKKEEVAVDSSIGNIKSEESDYSAISERTGEDVYAETSAEKNVNENRINILNVKNIDGDWSLPESVKCIAKLAGYLNKTRNGSKTFLDCYDRNKGNYNNYNKLDTKTIKEKALSSYMALNNNPNQKNDNTNQDQIESPSGLDFSFRDGPVNNSGHFGGVDCGSENSSTSGESNFTLGCHALEDEKVEGKKGEAEGQYNDVNVFMSFGPINN